MTGNTNFAELLDLYLAGKITPGQHNELMRMIKSGDFDGLLRARIDDAILHNDVIVNISESRTEELISNILNSEKHAAKLLPMTKSSHTYRRWYMAAAAVLVICLSIWILIPRKSQEITKIASSKNDNVPPVADKKDKKYLRLPDGSTVLLNDGSTLESPEAFDGDRREVVLKGEAYFDIRPDAAKPFIVHTGHVTTTVLGTAFNIKAYPGQGEVTVTVTRGKVKVSDDTKTIGVITPNESISVNLNDKSYRQDKVNAEDIIEWKKQYLVLDDISLKDAAVLIDNKYHVKISLSNDALRDCRIWATFLDNENLEQVLEVVTKVVNASYTIQPNDQVIISGDGCK